MFDEYFTPRSIAITPVRVTAAHRAIVLAKSLVSTSIDQDAPSTQEQEQLFTVQNTPSGALFLQLVDERLQLPPKQTPPEADKT
nr:hypothetical protein [Tanacetum cinerariifolium]